MALTNDKDVSALTALLQESKLSESTTQGLIDSSSAVSKLLDTMISLPIDPPSLYIDLEGVKLSRHGSISILQIHISPTNRTYLIDIHTLGQKAFSTPGPKGQTLKGILESSTIPKVIFDVRNDSDALFAHFKIRLAGIHDLQLMELATRYFSRRVVNGLAKCIERDISLSFSEREEWKRNKERGLGLFAPERGGSYEVFNARPLLKEILKYCVEDVVHMPKLWRVYDQKMSERWREKVRVATKERIELSQTETYNGQGRHMALAPSGWA